MSVDNVPKSSNPATHVNHPPTLQFNTRLSNLNVNIFQGDITKQKSEAIVNAANGLLLHNGGVAKAIADAVGSELRDECEQYVRNYGALRTSEVMHTTSGRLKDNVKYVIHAVGPTNREKDCEALLQQTFSNCLHYANNTLGITSISIPAISSGTVQNQHVTFIIICSIYSFFSQFK